MKASLKLLTGGPIGRIEKGMIKFLKLSLNVTLFSIGLGLFAIEGRTN
jgi:hypothetical protein